MNHPPVMMPSSWVKYRKLAVWMEAMQVAGCPLACGYLAIPAPTVGALSLLELSDNQFLRDWSTASVMELARAVAILQKGRTAILPVSLAIGDQPEQLDGLARDVLRAGGDAIVEHMMEIHQWISDVPWYGFDMIPRGGDDQGDGGTSFVFDGAGQIWLIQPGLAAGLGIEAATWEVSVCRLGHLAQVQAKAAGEKGVRRPDDHDDVRKQLQLARERAAAGIPQPWDQGFSRADWEKKQMES